MANQKIIIGLTGQIACGKGAIKKYLMEKYGASDYRFSTILRDILIRLQIEVNRENMQNLSTLLRQNFGEDTLAKAMAHDVENDPHDFIVIDGIRRMADITSLKDVSGFHLIKVTANEKLRFLRVVFRNENVGDDKKSFADFLDDQNQEAEAEVPIVMENATYEINNEGTFEELEANIDELVKKIKINLR